MISASVGQEFSGSLTSGSGSQPLSRLWSRWWLRWAAASWTLEWRWGVVAQIAHAHAYWQRPQCSPRWASPWHCLGVCTWWQLISPRQSNPRETTCARVNECLGVIGSHFCHILPHRKTLRQGRRRLCKGIEIWKQKLL